MSNKLALQSEHKQHRMGAVIVKGGNIVSVGFNQMRPSALLRTPTLHAEAAAVLKLLKEGRQHDLIGADIFVSRFTRGGSVGLAKPCVACQELLRSVGIRSTSYTTDDGNTMKERL